MYSRILVPVDLAHAERLSKALKTAADLARHYDIPVCYAGVSAETPGSIAHSPKEYGEKLAAFARDQAELHGVKAESRPVFSHDPSIDLDEAIVKAVKESEADLVVMASHIPNIADRFWPSNGGRVAARSDASVFVVRGT
ncbi:MAG: universal stress protein UspA [Stappia sp.]|uniref:universal stress protein n=1 Tax=Stappia sp. TaxID=1870903 RepID=UPI000C46B127|nr:universal stress protein [Stappia sp.]MAA98304.1 universal stress protein UspA [Stappia sp.]MBM20877.1 universal stress protein UspA [Stappia sp.]|tara:strand:- start:376 stop:795 length:420 start_codon:yes stop_codon:yes gene_type:complete